jgi:hypothetical protein
MSAKKEIPRMRMHLLVPMPGGPVHSRPAQGGPGTHGMGGSMPLGTSQTYIIACEPSLAMDGVLQRGTTEPWCVRCDACRQTDYFLAIDRPRPGTQRAARQMEADGSGCCG